MCYGKRMPVPTYFQEKKVISGKNNKHIYYSITSDFNCDLLL